MSINESGNHLVTDQDREEVHAAESDEADEARRRNEKAEILSDRLLDICIFSRGPERFISALEKAGILIGYDGEEFGRLGKS